MINKNIKGFTLVELIVVITILAILGTLAFISLQGYSRDSRDSARVSDLAMMKKALSVVAAVSGKYPDPDNFVEVTYSGATVLKQGTFGDSVRIALSGNISKVPLDPLFDIEYNYSVINLGNQFEVSTIMEGGLISYDYDITNKTAAISDSDVAPYVSGDYYYNDIKVSTGSNCYVITIPGLTINNFTSSGEIAELTNYKFIYAGGDNIPTNYLGDIDVDDGTNFQIVEVYNKCSIDTIDDLNSYVSKLSTAYQQLNGVKKFEDIIFLSHTTSFKLNAITRLKKDEIAIASNIATRVKDLAPYNPFTDSFDDTDDTLLSTHIPDSNTSWSWSGTISGSKYKILSGELVKVDGSNETIFPVPNPPYGVSDTKTSFDIKYIDTGSIISIYSNYTNNNHYELRLEPDGYKIFYGTGVTSISLSDINQTISSNSKIDFNVANNTIVFSIDDVEKERIIAPFISGVGISGINITGNARIDNYSLQYK